MVAGEADKDRMRKVIIETSALVIGFSLFNASAMAADDNGRVTFHGQIIDGDSPCLIGHADNDRAILCPPPKPARFIEG